MKKSPGAKVENLIKTRRSSLEKGTLNSGKLEILEIHYKKLVFPSSFISFQNTSKKLWFYKEFGKTDSFATFCAWCNRGLLLQVLVKEVAGQHLGEPIFFSTKMFFDSCHLPSSLRFLPLKLKHNYFILY